MKKMYFKMKVKFIALVMIVLILGSGLLTYLKAESIRREIVKNDIKSADFIELLSESIKSSDLEEITQNVYEVLDSRQHGVSSDVTFYCMLKDESGNILAEGPERYIEAKELCEKIYIAEEPKDVNSDFRTQTHAIYLEEAGNLFTYYKYGNDYIGNNRYTLSFVYVFHPIRLAMEELWTLYGGMALFGIASIFFICFTVNKLYKQQLASEMNRRQLTRAIAHELKTPLAITEGYIENWAYLDEEKREESAKVIKDEIKYMNHMVTDLLELSRLEARAKEIHPELVDLHALTQSIVKRMKGIIEERGLVLCMDENIPSDKYLVNGDLEMMRIVLSNFVSNAVKYAEKEIRIDFLEKGRNVKFVITNDGRSIKYKIDQVWDEFYKEDKENYSRMGSSGIGLAITKNILILHDAKYGCDSEEGKTSFWFEMKKEKEDI